ARHAARRRPPLNTLSGGPCRWKRHLCGGSIDGDFNGLIANNICQSGPRLREGLGMKGVRSMGALSGKVCIITGGAGSLGQATARLFIAEGARVMLVDVKESELQQAAEDLK